MVTEIDVAWRDGRRLHAYDTGPDSPAALAVFWLHGTPNTGEPPEPLFAAAAERGIRWVSYDRPSYGGSSPLRGRTVASAAVDIAAVADVLGLRRFAVMGHSGGGPHALAAGALLAARVIAVVSVSGLAPYDAEGLDWYAGMGAAGAAESRAAAHGRDALTAFLAAEEEFDPEMFTAEDWAALQGPWAWLGGVAGQAIEAGPDGLIDDKLAYVAPWGFEPADVRQPVLVVHGGQDRMVPSAHGEWLARHLPTAELRLSPADGHISVLLSADEALDWLREQANGRWWNG
jgi:pimeloyl-ACP methyl ester carboxylesterase